MAFIVYFTNLNGGLANRQLFNLSSLLSISFFSPRVISTTFLPLLFFTTSVALSLEMARIRGSHLAPDPVTGSTYSRDLLRHAIFVEYLL